MRKPENIEHLYLDFDGFFASVEQQARPALRNRPVGVVPFEGTDRTCLIACSREAKIAGIKSIMGIREAREMCPSLILVPQSPDLYRRAHNALVSEISSVIPISAIKSIDELTCRIVEPGKVNPEEIGHIIKSRIRDRIGPYITCSIGMAGNRQLAKMACKAGKWGFLRSHYGDGLNVWHPEIMPEPLLKLALDDIPGVGSRMKQRLYRNRIYDMESLLKTHPKQLRQIWRNVTGERLWYALHGYEIQIPATDRGMFGHGRVLPPGYRNFNHARSASRLLLTKAGRRLRRENWNADLLWLWFSFKDRTGFTSWQRTLTLPSVQDDHAILTALEDLWKRASYEVSSRCDILQVHVALSNLTPASERQLDIFLNDDRDRQRWEAATKAIDTLNSRYGQTVVSLGPWSPPPGGYAGGKISYTRIPSADDFW